MIFTAQSFGQAFFLISLLFFCLHRKKINNFFRSHFSPHLSSLHLLFNSTFSFFSLVSILFVSVPLARYLCPKLEWLCVCDTAAAATVAYTAAF